MSSIFFLNYSSCSGKQKIKVANGTFSLVVGQGSVQISKSIKLNFVLHVPNLSYNLLYIRKITKDLNCLVKFTPTGCYFQDQLGKMIGHGKLKDGLYYLDTDMGNVRKESQCLVSHKTCFDLTFGIID